MGIKLIVGLGNPGSQYNSTRHNVGCWLVEKLAEQHNASFKNESKFKGQYSKIIDSNATIHLLMPTTYMNESGQSVVACANFLKIEPQNILIVHDELDFNPGTIKIKQDGGHGGHNGLRSIMTHLIKQNFYRLRIGIGHPGHRDMVSSYVLSKPSLNDKNKIEAAIDEGLKIIPELINGEFEKAMRNLHGV
ncbi:MAG: aminoacyl-tRNA hydrolase [Gammaproteobacteria bacterium]|nr:aminoacyl-tRNA hydrolase [Gammaproteobacteria bacterium]